MSLGWTVLYSMPQILHSIRSPRRDRLRVVWTVGLTLDRCRFAFQEMGVEFCTVLCSDLREGLVVSLRRALMRLATGRGDELGENEESERGELGSEAL